MIGAAAFLATPALATDPKPDAAIKTKAIEASVFLDARIKANPALSADCLAEGKRWMDKNAAEAAASQDPQFFRDGGWSFARKYLVRSVVADRYVSIVRDGYLDTHGAHPNTDVDTIIWDEAAKKSASASARSSLRPPTMVRSCRRC